jgi:two-component system, cell cycle sensor histidine kinase and response regulator CckA
MGNGFMSRLLRALIIEDRKADAQLLIVALRRADFAPSVTVVDTETGFEAALGSEWDVILSDFNLPQFDALKALRRLQESRLDIPFIIVSGSIGEDTAVQAIRAGADDYLLKDRLGRLGQAVIQALERKELREAQRKTEIQLQNVLASSPSVIFSLELEHNQARLRWISDNVIDLLGYDSRELLVPERFEGLLFPEDRPRHANRSARLRADGRLLDEFRIRHKNETYRWIREEIRLVDRPGNPVNHFVGSWSDVTELKEASDSLLLFRHLIDVSTDAIQVIDPATGQFLDANQKAWQSLGYSREEFLRLRVRDIDPAVAAMPWLDCLTEIKSSGYRILEGEHIRRDGTRFSVEINVKFVQSSRDCLVAIVRDISERKKAEELLRQSEEKYRQMFECNPQPMWLYDIDTLRFAAVNDAAVAHYGFSRQEFLALTIKDIRSEEDVPVFLEHIACPLASMGETRLWRHRKKDGALIDVEITSHELQIDRRNMRLVLAHDVTEQRRANAEREQLVTILQATPDLVAVSNLEGPVSFMNLAGRTLLGVGSHERVSLLEHRSDWAKKQIMEQAIPIASREGVWAGETAFVSRSDEEIPVSQVLIAHKNPSGAIAYFSVIARDIRGQRQLEAQFRQSQKMEAIGQLAGGIAHDFNNLLTIISGYSEILMANCPRGDDDHELIKEICNASERAAQLTRQLLVFSRKQVVEFKVLDLNSILSSTQRMLSRLIGEDIALEFNLTDRLGLVKADPCQIEQVLINLAVNARDAMPRGGKLIFETVSVLIDEAAARRAPGLPTGRYVRLSVKDTGCGMNQAVRSRLFEPFFTTKDPGKGTGLGLATVFGIIKQSGGFLDVESEVGRGACFTIYLPALQEQTCSGSTQLETAPGPRRGTETILLVEDDDSVRSFTCIALRSLGYHVIATSRPSEAISLCRENAHSILLVISDVVLPEMGGRQLIEQIASLVPDIKVLYVSGYADDAVVRHGVLKSEVAFLQKPFTIRVLSEKVRETIEATELHQFV